MNIEFECSNCGQRLRAKRTSIGKLCKCTKCSTLVRIVQPKVEASLVEPVELPPPPNLVDLNNLAWQPPANSYPNSIGGGSSPQASSDIWSYPAASSSAFGPSPKSSKPRKKKRSKSSSGATSVITIVLSVFGTLGLLCCGGVVVLGLAMGPRTITMTAGEYAVAAQGKQTTKERNGEGAIHPFTGSEFWIMYENLPMGSAATIEDVRVYSKTISARTEFVERGSLRGLHCYQVNTAKLGIRGGADAEMEMFLVGGKLLITAYIPGTSKASANGRTVSEAAKNRSQRMDNAAAFFASLKPTGS